MPLNEVRLPMNEVRFAVELSDAGGVRSRDMVATIDERATVADLLDALRSGGHIPTDVSSEAHLLIAAPDRRTRGVAAVDSKALLDGRLVEGCTLRICAEGSAAERARGPRGATPDERAVREVAVVGGLDAGATRAITSLRTIVGRTPPADVVIDDRTVSDRHVQIQVRDGTPPAEVADLGSYNGTFVNERPVEDRAFVADGDIVRIGASELEVRGRVANDRPAGLGTSSLVAFNRPPRMATPSSASALTPPKPLAELGPRSPVRIAAVLVPLVFAGVLVRVTHNPVFALFALMSPVMMLANAAGDRRHNRRRGRREAARHAAELAAFEEAIVAAAAECRDDARRRLTDLAEVARRASVPSRRLWERRASHDDALLLRVGSATCSWSPLLTEPATGIATGALEVLRRHDRIVGMPVGVDLRAGALLGIAGPRDLGLALARALVVQIATLHGPSDVELAIATDAPSLASWDWAKWLPHLSCSGEDAGTPIAVGADDMIELARRLQSDAVADEAAIVRQPTTVIVIDGPGELQRAVQLRRMLGPDARGAEPRSVPSSARHASPLVSAIVLAPSIDALPANCTAIVSAAAEPETDEASSSLAHIDVPASGTTVEDVLIGGMSVAAARRVGMDLARFRDPDVLDPGAGLPLSASIRSLCGLSASAGGEGLSSEIAERWHARAADARASAVIGVSDAGPLRLDLGRDGPHGLVGGTTGAGKSELLRTLVLGLAVECTPEELTFVFIDYKGGSAFDACARLPHVVGLVTDLDVALSARAVRCLEAELRHRERLLRAAEVSDRESYARRGSPGGPLPRLVIVVDEFAALKSELPAFVDALIDVAQRGRSLGVHLILATQRPAGVVSDLIRANTEFKVALRMQDASDSVDVIGSPIAARLPRARPGRAVLRVGSDEPLVFQSAYTGSPAVSVDDRPRVEVRPFSLVSPRAASPKREAPDAHAPTELDLLVDAVAAAARSLEFAPPRRPWPDPLPDDLPLRGLGVAGTDDGAEEPVIGIVDDPDHQRMLPLVWDRSRGNLLLVGSATRTTSAAMTTIICAHAMVERPDRLHVYGLGVGIGWMPELSSLPHVGDLVRFSERARLLRLVRFLAEERQRRLEMSPSQRDGLPAVLVMIESMSAAKAELDDPLTASGPFEQLIRVLQDGPAIGMFGLVGVDRPSMLTGPLGAIAEQRWVFELSDRLDLSAFGLRAADVPALGGLRMVLPDSGLCAQVATPPDAEALAAIAHRHAEAPNSTRPRPVAVLPETVSLGDLAERDGAAAALISARPWRFTVGTSDVTLGPVAFDLHAGEHVLVCGPTRSGRTSVLEAFGASMSEAGGHVVLIAPSRSPLADRLPHADVVRPHSLGDVVDLLGPAPADGGSCVHPQLVLVDDAELVEDPQSVLAGLIASERSDLAIVAAVRSEHLRTNYGHWSRLVRRSRVAILLRPTDSDAEFAGVPIPRRAPAMDVGRGYLALHGTLELVQFAHA